MTPPDPDDVVLLGGQPLRPGDAIDAYVFEREVGGGGMARVLLARGPDDRRVALKVLRKHRFDSGLSRFRREFHALSRLSHPNIVRVEAYGDVRGHPYIAMEYVDGPDLHAVIRAFRDLPDPERWARAQRVLVDLCRALAAIHRRGLVHRDLKPSNVLLTQDGVSKLTDFGIVKEIDPGARAEVSTTLVGTWAYASPEHIQGQPIDHRSDLYSLGVILFAMLTGKRPFVAETMQGYLQHHRDSPAPRAAELRRGVPPILDEIAARLLEKEPRRRFQSAREVLFRLEVDDEVPPSLDGHEGWEPPLVGDREVPDRVEEAVHAVVREGAVLRIEGADGGGKTRTLQVAVDRARMLGLPFHLLGFHAEDPVFAATRRLARELLRELPESQAQELSAVVGLGSEDLVGDRRYALYDAVLDGLRQVLADRPRLLLLDDVHLAHPAERDLVRYLIRQLVGSEARRLLVVLTARTGGFGADLAKERLGLAPTDLRLTPLALTDLVVVVGSLIGPGRPARLVAERLHAETEGNPYFATEFLRSWIAQDLIRRTDDGWRVTIDPEELATTQLEIPPGIRSLLRRRVSDLDPGDRRVLDVVAVAGTELDLDLLLEVLDVDDEEGLDRLDRLLIAGLLRERRDGDALHYAIVHRKLADLLERDLDPDVARTIHEDLAEALDDPDGSDPERLMRLGEHARRAGQAGRAYRALVTASRHLVDRTLLADAWDLSERAAEVEQNARYDLDERTWQTIRAEHLGVRGRVHFGRAEWTAASRAWDEQIGLAEILEDEDTLCEARIDYASALRRMQEVDAALAEAREALSLSRQRHHRSGVARALHLLAVLAWGDGDLDGCMRLANEGLLVAQGPELAPQRARLLLVVSAARAVHGQLASAVRGLEEANALFFELRMKAPAVLALTNLAELRGWRGEPEAARATAEEAVELAEEVRYPLGHAAALRARGMALAELGRSWEASQDLHRALREAEEIGVPEEVIASATALLLLSLEVEDGAGAQRHAARALTAARDRDPEHYLPLAQAACARALAAHRPGVAWTLLQAVEDAIPTLAGPRRDQVLVTCGEAWDALGDAERAQEHARAVISRPSGRDQRLVHLRARALLLPHATGEERSRHERIGRDLVEDVRDTLAPDDVPAFLERPAARRFAVARSSP